MMVYFTAVNVIMVIGWPNYLYFLSTLKFLMVVIIIVVGLSAAIIILVITVTEMSPHQKYWIS